jgi:hypothetical protein
VLNDAPAPRAALGRAETALLFAVAVALPLGVALAQGMTENPFGNMGFVHVLEARQVLAGRGFGRLHEGVFHPDLFLRPTYTLFVAPVAALVDGWTSLRAPIAALQGVLLAVTALAVAGCLARAGAARASRLAAWAVVLHPVLVSQASTLVDTLLFACAMTGSYAFVAATPADAPRRRWLVAGLIFGVALLTRSTAIAVAPAAALALCRTIRPWRGRLAAAGLVAVGAAAVLAPWFARNHALTGRWMLSTVDGVNLWMGNNANTSAFLDADRSLDELPGRPRFDASERTPVEVQLERYDASRAAASEFIRARPGEAAVLAARKAADLWAIRPTPRSTRATWHEAKSVVAVLFTVPFFALAALGAVVGLRAGGAPRSFVVDVLVTCVVFTIPHAMAWGGTRLRAPVEPFVAALAALGLAAVLDRVQSRSAGATSQAAAASNRSGSSG